MPPVPACVGFSQDRMTLEMHTHPPMFREKRHISCTVFAQWNDVGFLWDPQPRNSASAFTFPNGDSWSCFKGTDQCFGWFICQHYPCTNGHLLFNYQSQLFWDPVQVSLPQNSPHTQSSNSKKVLTDNLRPPRLNRPYYSEINSLFSRSSNRPLCEMVYCSECTLISSAKQYQSPNQTFSRVTY